MRKLTNQDFDHMVTFFDQMAQTSWLSAIHQTMVSYLPPQQDLNVLDVGCGTGRFLQRIGSRLKKGVGIDLSPEMIKEARRQAIAYHLTERLEFHEGDAYELPVKDGTFDVAISTCVMFLLPEPEKGIAELGRALKNNGSVLMLNPSPLMNPESALEFAMETHVPEHEREYLLKWSNVSTRKHRYSKEGLQQLLTQNSFTNTQVIEVMNGLAHITLAQKR